ncbi:hypothetical protein A8924_4839 [Saccharopolyspora erythraea NRRL 2338]|uniref:Uncharacterized protein n=2 Tax=Saccharopolyspora erythraea TaxID=1836 RepID=A4FI45_SACEN|nr:hypothetical protein [Saccharopolyspora erythraea]EQD86223.1 hypothetical protein N599_10820 [Saccharopolyspora erythraea D]PFG97403.1 hypothetical protein A8924_4839 [Saccharopolyspora erythraea NRRL 2338]QRK87584.1 hypothetical protein JQX30_22675 [Saccharopolyspora erythraea]CAM03720.1 hypothetical protein SACE_4451 [Saccharopolyspora erythraea NRRL 2338]
MTPAPQEPGRDGSEEPENPGGSDNSGEQPEASGEQPDNQAADSEEHPTPAESEEPQDADQQDDDQQAAGEQGIDQQAADQQDANEQDANEQDANEQDANEQGADQHEADQQGADQQGADQQDANEQGTDQQGTDQHEADQAGEADAVPAGKRKTGLVVGIAAAVLVLAGGAAAGYVYLWGASAQSVAEDYAALATQETQDPRSVTAESYRPFVCSQVMPAIEQLQQEKNEFLKVAQPQDLEQLRAVKTSVKSVQENGDSGTAALESTIPGQPPQSTNLKLTKEDGDWKLCA